MTSFQRFKRDVRSKSISDVRSSAFRSNQKKDLNIHNLVSFSASQITFVYDQQIPISTFKLRITNLTGYRIHFKIRCNNSKCYSVTPYEQVISDKQSADVRFQFQPNTHDFTSNYSDKFQIIWGRVPYQPNQPTALTQSKVFPVYIQPKDPNQDLFKAFDSKRIDDQKYALRSEAKGGNSFPSQNKIKYDTINPSSTLLTKTNLILVCLISFILGFIFS